MLVGKLAVASHTKQTLLLASLLTRRVWSATLTGTARKRNERKVPKAPTIPGNNQKHFVCQL